MGWILLLALALSVDNLGVGVSYGIRNMLLPWYGILIICGCSALVLALSMILGRWFGQFVSPDIMQLFGSGLLIALGLYLLVKSVREMIQEETDIKPLVQWKISRIGVIIQILKEPQKADLDRSGQINGKEAFWLGCALSIDSCGAGIGMALLGYPTLLMSISVAIGGCICLCLGLYLGNAIGANASRKNIKLLPGILLFFVGLVRLFW